MIAPASPGTLSRMDEMQKEELQEDEKRQGG
jgi:hypothetical protein